MFKKEGFGTQLRLTRKNHKLSQFDFVSQLANSHKEFTGLSQTTLSLWENGKREPSFLRRIAIARFFAEGYEMSEQEKKFVSKTKATEIGGRPAFYPVNITDIAAVDFSNLTEKQAEVVNKGHEHFYTAALTETMAAFPPAHYTVSLLMNENAIVGHYIASNTGMIVSFCFIDNSVAIKMVLDLDGKFTSVVLPTRTPAIASFFQDLHFEPYPTASRVKFYKGSLKDLYQNPFFKDLLNNNADLVRFSKAQKG